MKAQMNDQMKELYDLAKSVRERSYSPYSGCKVGAAIRTADGRTYSGCNMENSSYGASVCAERAAIQNAVSSQGKVKIAELLVVTDSSPPWPPCGICRQVIVEFAREQDILIHAANLQGEVKSTALKDLFPDAFTPAHLHK